MKRRLGLVFSFALVTSLVLCSCQDTGPRKIGVAWAPGYVYVPRCKPLVKYQGTSFEVQGVKIPVPQLGGVAEVGGVKIEPKVLNQAYLTTQILDASYHQNCDLLPSFSTDKEKFEQAVQRMENSQTKLQQLAMSLQSGGGGTAPAPAPAPEKKSATAAATAKPNDLGPAVMTGSSMSGGAKKKAAARTKKVDAKKLTKWVETYAKEKKSAVVDTPAKSNSTLGLPASSPSPTPHR